MRQLPSGSVYSMALEFEICTACAESHAIRPDGLGMAIHDDADGALCPGPAIAVRPPRTARAPDQPGKKTNPELQAAFEVARKRRGESEPHSPFDRQIYVTGPQHKVAGGLPTLGRRR
jgi:hypothetical protein